MSKVKIAIFGLGRGASYYKSIMSNDALITAVCDYSPKALDKAREELGDGVKYYCDFEDLLKDDSYEAVFLANYFHQHADYAVKMLQKNVHVLSECTSNATMAQGVRLARAAQESKAFFMLAENYPFMLFNLEMKKVYREGSLGRCLFAEGEYNHPIDMYDNEIIRSLHPFEKHWRNFLPRTYYVTHSLAPLMSITGAKPVRVTAMPVFCPDDGLERVGSHVLDKAAIITILNDDRSVFRVTGCAAFGNEENSYRICCEKGQMENIRGGHGKVSLRYSKWQIPEGMERYNEYMPQYDDKDEALIKASGHGGGDFLVMSEFLRCVREKRNPEFDVWFATAMASVGILSHRSLLKKGEPVDIPDLSKKEDQTKYENDELTPFWGPNGEAPTIPCCSEPDHPLNEKYFNEYKEIVKDCFDPFKK